MTTETVHRSGGIIMKSHNDSTTATFPATNHALRAAIAAQEAILADQTDMKNTLDVQHVRGSSRSV
jgi:hypothetical protein